MSLMPDPTKKARIIAGLFDDQAGGDQPVALGLVRRRMSVTGTRTNPFA